MPPRFVGITSAIRRNQPKALWWQYSLATIQWTLPATTISMKHGSIDERWLATITAPWPGGRSSRPSTRVRQSSRATR